MLDEVVKWSSQTPNNIDTLVIGVVVGLIILKLASIKLGVPTYVKKFFEMKVGEVIAFFLNYIITPIAIIDLTMENYNKPVTYRTLFTLTLLITTYVFNILMSHILTLYKITEIHQNMFKVSSSALEKQIEEEAKLMSK
ncbi:hypothetical protein [Flavobacterium sp. YO64]|uniref:hypothetical protein n=1 Tax=Flavobacterium sp. YO64 TaxID=394559 RepID=UPI00100AFC5C|nr:hypothetical protein [Flavobacterium sp. YO64]